ncbi:MAG: hypothetical protein ACM3Y9_07530 [Ignavibacteria bacterium]
MDGKITAPDNVSLNCQVCGHFGTTKCSFDETPPAPCDAFLSWSDLWQREMAAIKRAQRTTYVVAALVAALAVVVMILPNLLT